IAGSPAASMIASASSWPGSQSRIIFFVIVKPHYSGQKHPRAGRRAWWLVSEGSTTPLDGEMRVVASQARRGGLEWDRRLLVVETSRWDDLQHRCSGGATSDERRDEQVCVLVEVDPDGGDSGLQMLQERNVLAADDLPGLGDRVERFCESESSIGA